jgi:hypothetical protein
MAEGCVPDTCVDTILAETKILDLDRKSPSFLKEEKGKQQGDDSNQAINEEYDIEEALSRSVSELEASSEWEYSKGLSKDDPHSFDPGKLSVDLTEVGIETELVCANEEPPVLNFEEDGRTIFRDAPADSDEGEDLKDRWADPPPAESDDSSMLALRDELTQAGISSAVSEAAGRPVEISRSPSPSIAGLSIEQEEAPPSRASSGVASPVRLLCVDVTENGARASDEAAEDGSRDERPKAVMPWPQRADKEYECLESCGAGSYGEVYKARRRGDEMIVAVKVIESDKDALEEAALLRDLDHKCICKLYDCFECPEEGVTCLVMQYASGGDLLSKIISSGPLTEKVAAGLSKQLLLALQHMHSQGVLHRDLKPENVLYLTDSMEQPLLADFGVGKRLAVHSKREESLGSLGSIEEAPPPIRCGAALLYAQPSRALGPSRFWLACWLNASLGLVCVRGRVCA